MTTTTEHAIAHLVIDEEIRHQAHEFETASAYNVYLLQPGRYPFDLTTIGGQPWVPGHIESGMVKPGGPYYANARIEAKQVEHYYESRLFTASSVQHDHMDKPTTYRFQVYAYELGNRKTFFQSKARIELSEYWRENTYRPIADLDDSDYCRMLSMAVWWLRKHGHGDYSQSPHWHVWNRVNAQAMGGIEGYVKAIVEEWAAHRARFNR